MRKIYRVRHIENMIQLCRRAARTSKTESGKRNSAYWVDRYQHLLNIVKDSQNA